MNRLSCDDPDVFKKLASILATSSQDAQVAQVVSEVLDSIRVKGDDALLAFTKEFDHAVMTPDEIRVSEDEFVRSIELLAVADRDAIEEAKANVMQFHAHSHPEDWMAINSHGGKVGERHYPLNRIGVYVPGGQVPLVSTVIMTTSLAQAAGVPEIAVATPPRPDGSISPALLAALSLCGVDEVYKVGGAQAIAAFAHGTKSIPTVDKIFGPGNAYVNEAKRQVFGTVGIDLLPGPSEVMVIVDETANPAFAAAALLAQAEHGSGKETVFLVSESYEIIEQVLVELEDQIKGLEHRESIERCLEAGLCVLHAKSETNVIEVANFIAPEHLELQVHEERLEGFTAAISTAGAIFQGHDSPTVLGDFAAGPSHVLPTGRASRFSSGLRLSDFLRRSSIVRYDREALEAARSVIESFSAMENLDAHGRSLTIRLENPEA